MCGWQVKLCDPLVTHGPYLSTLEIRVGIIKRYRNWSVYLLTLLLPHARVVYLLSMYVRIAKDLIHEAQMHKLRHPNIVMLLAVTFEQHHYGVVFEYVTYGGLDGFVEEYEVRFATGIIALMTVKCEV